MRCTVLFHFLEPPPQNFCICCNCHSLQQFWGKAPILCHKNEEALIQNASLNKIQRILSFRNWIYKVNVFPKYLQRQRIKKDFNYTHIVTILALKRKLGNVHKAACKCTPLSYCYSVVFKLTVSYIFALGWNKLLKNTAFFYTKTNRATFKMEEALVSVISISVH